MDAELVQVRMTKSVDFGGRGELIWLEPVLAKSIIGMGLAREVRRMGTEEVAGGDSGEGDDQPAAGDTGGSSRKRARGAQDS